MHSLEFLRLLEKMKDLHVRKSAGYAGVTNPDPWKNFRTSTGFGVEPWRGTLIRMGDKWSRLQNLVQSADNEQVGESIDDTAMDLAAYALIFLCLYHEDPGLPENRPYQPSPICMHDGIEDASGCPNAGALQHITVARVPPWDSGGVDD